MLSKLTLCVVCKNSITSGCTIALLQTLVYHQTIAKGLDVEIDFQTGNSNICHARSIALSKWYLSARSGDVFAFIDSDQVFQATDVFKLANRILDKDADIICGLYKGGHGHVNCVPFSIEFPEHDEPDNDLLAYGATGFMAISYDICKRIEQKIQELDGIARLRIGSMTDVIPFFQNRIIDDRWLGEDYSFCWLARASGGTIRGYVSSTLGHEVSKTLFIPEGV